MRGHRMPVRATANLWVAGILLVQSASTGPALATSRDLRGFTPANASTERALEQKFEKVPDAEHAQKELARLTSAPHLAGTEASHLEAEWLREQYAADGFDAEIVQYSVWMPLLKQRQLELLAPEKQQLATPEKPLEVDKDTFDARAVPGVNGYSPSGDVTGDVVYVNYGMIGDYRRLATLGVNVEGKIVLARYGEGYRGVKAKLAQEHKAAGLLIFSDPADDGYMAGDAFPRGPWRPMSGVQRGSILYTSTYPGDPLTPGVASTPDAHRLAPSEAKNLPQIPTLPINAQDAAVILSNMSGQAVPHGWQGGLPFTYHVGPGQARVHLRIEMEYAQRPIYDVIARMKGEDDNQWVVLGNHHDAWVFGAADPNSGTTVMVETARGLGELARNGWKPKRTIVMCEWDAEEEGLIGSTEWVEANEAELQKKAVAYINMDVGVTGPNFGGSATPSLKEFIRDVTRDVNDPHSGRSVYDEWKEYAAKEAGEPTGSARALPPASPKDETPLTELGSGSDFCAFFDHVGIPSLDIGSGGPYGVYHSLYDDFYWMKHFGDPTFAYHAEMARILGVLTLRLSQADLLPFDYTDYAEEASEAAKAIEKRVQSEKSSLDMKEVFAAAAAMQASSGRLDKVLRSMSAGAPDSAHLERLNRMLVLTEQDLLDPAGLAGRPWYRHTLFAPGIYTGYAAVVMPGITGALDAKDAAGAQQQTGEVAAALRRAATRLDAAAAIAESPSGALENGPGQGK
jgi:N-acetylated-alpha-linked acidic dipeptidase